jgi:hypothetical protein
MPLIDFSAGRLDVRYHAADGHTVEVDWSVDLEGYDVASELRSLVDNALIAELETDAYDKAAGKVRTAFPSGLAPGTYSWVQRWSSADDSQTGFVGYVEVLP